MTYRKDRFTAIAKRKKRCTADICACQNKPVTTYMDMAVSNAIKRYILPPHTSNSRDTIVSYNRICPSLLLRTFFRTGLLLLHKTLPLPVRFTTLCLTPLSIPKLTVAHGFPFAHQLLEICSELIHCRGNCLIFYQRFHHIR